MYEQITQYLAWFEQSEKFKGKKVYGIICLNHPAQELLSKVHADKRIRIFEYQISYTELGSDSCNRFRKTGYPDLSET